MTPTGPLGLLLGALIALVMLGGATGAGLVVLRWAARRAALPQTRRDSTAVPDALTIALAVPLGLGLLAQLLWAFGVGRLFRPLPLALLAAALLVLAARELPALWSRRRQIWCGDGPAWPRRLVATVLVAAPLLLALYPAHAWDETMYHLPMARAYAVDDGYALAENLRIPVFPLLTETLFTPFLEIGEARGTHLLSALLVLATAGLLAAWCREASTDRRLPLLAAALWLGQPLVAYLGGTAMVEPALALFATAAVAAGDRWRRTGSDGWALLAGAFAGWAAASKYLGLLVLPVLAAAVLLNRSPARGLGVEPDGETVDTGAFRHRLRSVATLLLGGALAAAPWYLLIVAWTGNPLFPFAGRLFGDNPWLPAVDLGDRGADGALRWRDYPLALLTIPWELAIHRRLGNLPPLSPLVVLAWPALAWAAWRRPWLRPAAALAAAMLAVIPALPHDPRYAFQVAPALTVIVVVALLAAVDRLRRGMRLAVAALVALAIVGGPGYAVFRMSRVGPPPLGVADEQAWLRRQLPLYGAAEAANRLSGEETRIYVLGPGAERMFLHLRGIQLGEHTGPWRFPAVLRELPDAHRVARVLRGFGASYLLVSRQQPGAEGLGTALRLVYEDEQARLYAIPAEAGR